MIVEQAIVTVLGVIFPGRIWPDTPPDGFSRAQPFAIFQQVGGKEEWFVDQATPPSHENSRMQFNVYAKTRMESRMLMQQVNAAIRNSGWTAKPEGAPISGYEAALKLYETRQDFSIWYPVSP